MKRPMRRANPLANTFEIGRNTPYAMPLKIGRIHGGGPARRRGMRSVLAFTRES